MKAPVAVVDWRLVDELEETSTVPDVALRVLPAAEVRPQRLPRAYRVRAGRKGPRRRYSGIVGFFGLPGSGKTYSMTEFGLRCWREGRPVYSNQGYSFGWGPSDRNGDRQQVLPERVFTYSSFDELVDVALATPNACILVDELPLYFNARRWQDFPDAVLYGLTQARKDGLRFAYSAMVPEMADSNIRNVTMKAFRCRGVGVSGKRFVRAEWGPLVVPAEKPKRRQLVRVRNAISGLYDTDAKVSVNAPKRAKRESEQWSPGGRAGDAPKALASAAVGASAVPAWMGRRMTTPRESSPEAPWVSRPVEGTRPNAQRSRASRR